MRLIVDANVIVSSLVTRGVSFKVFALNSLMNKFEFVAPDFIISEILKHKDEFLKESKLSEETFINTLNFLFEEISIVSGEDFKEFVPQAIKLLPNHVKDVPYVALAMKLDCPIFSGEKRLKALPSVKVFTPRELFGILSDSDAR